MTSTVDTSLNILLLTNPRLAAVPEKKAMIDMNMKIPTTINPPTPTMNLTRKPIKF